MSHEPPIEVVILGSGTSHGVPMIGCRCSVCTSCDPRDKRTRPSIFVRVGGTQILVDAAPELRLQCLTHGIDAVDALLLTHHHADHVAGLDDVRRFNWISKRSMPCYGTPRTLAGVRQMFAYAFEAAPDSPHSRPQIELLPIDRDPFRVGEATVVPIPLFHGPMPVLGFRFGRFAYCTDCSTIPPESFRLLNGLDVLILDALRPDPHPTHLSVSQAVAMAQRIGARRTFFTHMAHQLGHAETNRSLPNGMELAYDGLAFRVESQA
jgi:phosphoribosyl 1,2-cyclic phosphate phosphodiesterase